MKSQGLYSNEKGLAMVLAISMVGLLSLLGIWLVLQSETGFKVTSALERRESIFQLSEGASHLIHRLVRDYPPDAEFDRVKPGGNRKYTKDEMMDYVPSGDKARVQQHIFDSPTLAVKGTSTPSLSYVEYSTLAPPGWILNKQGYLQYFSMFYKPMGDAKIETSKGNARSVLCTLTERVKR